VDDVALTAEVVWKAVGVEDVDSATRFVTVILSSF
jgi:hypothetical protein